MKVSVDLVKELRQITSASIAHCRKALEEAKGDIKKAAQYLRKHGLEIAAKKQDRHAKDGRIEAYLHHGNKLGVLVEIDCETDFVAKNSELCQFSKDVAMQIAATSPQYIKREDVPEAVIAAEKDKELFYKTNCLLEQAFIKDPGISIKDYQVSLIAKLGENIVIRRFMRYKIGE